MNYVYGDLVRDGEKVFEVITHGCNCFCNMGSGIAPQIKKKYPPAWEADKATIPGDKSKLGTLSYAIMEDGFIVVNSYTQYGCNKQDINIDYEALRNCMKQIKLKFSGKKIGLPKIGAGLARGDWNIIEKIIEEELSDEDVTVVLWDKNATMEEANGLLGDKTND
jgi:O-acetyl-ADP-ribose deacetylase (regulator of RNase III)